jgi:hypothetical protein
MKLTLNSSSFDKYFGFLLKLDTHSKKRLIIKLTESIDSSENKKIDLAMLHGGWEDSRSSDDIIKDIKISRIEKADNIDL